MKKLFAILFAAILLCLALPMTASAAGEYITDKFTDPAFRARVQELIGKEVILDTDVAAITNLSVGYSTVKNLAGLEYFKNLKSLHCSSSQVESIPALPSGLTALACAKARLTALPKLPSGLTYLDCSNNQLASLPKLPATLGSLNCSNNQLTSLPKLPGGLEQLSCSGNQLTSLPGLPKTIKRLYCADNQMQSLPKLPRAKDFTGEWDGVNFIFEPQRPPEPQSFWKTLWQWILKWIFFGWLWMK